MAISVVSRKLLWGRAADRCAWPGCEQLLTLDMLDAETKVLATHGVVIGEEAHIRSGRPEGPRYEEGFDRIDEYDNLILLCPTHHTVVDKEGGKGWSVDSLMQMKSDHEADVRARMEPTELLTRETAERMAAAVEYWAVDLLDQWQPLTYQLLLAYPRLKEERFQLLLDRSVWLLAKDWPQSYPKVAAAFARWQWDVQLFARHVNDTFEPVDGREQILELVRTHKRLGRWDPAAYQGHFDEFLLNCVVLWWLVGDLTRVTNLVISATRLEIDPLYRFHEGLVLIRAEDIIAGDTLIRLECENPNWEGLPIGPSLDDIKRAIKDAAAAKGYARYDDVKALFLDVPYG